jgi:hypothetical protein
MVLPDWLHVRVARYARHYSDASALSAEEKRGPDDPCRQLRLRRLERLSKDSQLEGEIANLNSRAGEADMGQTPRLNTSFF